MASPDTGSSPTGGSVPRSAPGSAAAGTPRRPAPQVMRITEAAAARVKELMARQQEQGGAAPIALRIGVGKRGCSGMSYELEYATEKKPLDEIVEDKGVTLLIDAQAQMFLFGTEIDYVEDKFERGFVFRNPNEKGRCGCGKSFHV